MNTIGKMRYRVELQSTTDTTDTGGGRAQTWSTLAIIYANIIPKSGTERYKHDKITDSVTHEMYIRYRTDIDPSYRIKYGSRTFSIKSILNVDERDRYQLLTCTEGQVGVA